MSAHAAIAAGADVNYSRDDWSCLTATSSSGHAETVALLLNAGADKEAKSEEGSTAFLMAAQTGHAECVELLLNAGAKTEAKQFEGGTAL
jgi:ankyrin repeat protein